MNAVDARSGNPLRVLAWFAWIFAAWAALSVAVWFLPVDVGSFAEAVLAFGAPLGGMVGAAFAACFLAFVARREGAVVQGVAALAINVGAAALFWFSWAKT